jgi:hypothetical protein
VFSLKRIMNSFSDKKSQLITEGRERGRQREEKGKTERRKGKFSYAFFPLSSL